MASTVNLHHAAFAPVPDQEPGDDAVAPTTPYESVLQKGFRWLRFPSQIEAEFQRDESAQRARLLRVSMGLATFLTSGLVAADWMMVPDVFLEAVLARLLFYVLPTVIWVMLFEHVAIH